MARARPAAKSSGPRPRARELGLAIGKYPTGPRNAITDVHGVRVGHVTRIEGEGPLVPGSGPIRTGITAILPATGDLFSERVFAASYVLNGAGEFMGLSQIDEWGLCETPILLCSTLSVGRVADATVAWMAQRHPKIGSDLDVVLPVVAECDDSFLNDAVGRHLSSADVWSALERAARGRVPEGCVGAGTGMMTFEFAGGIGTSSRRVRVAGANSIVGALVLSNFGVREHMRVDGVPVGRLIASTFAHHIRRRPAGSIIVLVATDAPLFPRQLARIARRASLAIGRTGGFAANNSGEIIVAWSTANRIPRTTKRGRHAVTLVLDHEMDPLYEATVDVVEEAILNAIFAGVEMRGYGRHVAPALPISATRDVLRRYRPSTAK
jgi:D-aminopeptidase